MDKYGFYTGQIFDAYEFLGAHATDEGYVFRTFAPGAAGVCLLHGADAFEIPMQRILDGNFYEVHCKAAKAGDVYEYRIYFSDGRFQDHCDPYGFGMELRPAHKSIVRDLRSYIFGDEAWMQSRTVGYDRPLNIYELHLGSWRRPEGEDWLRYDELAEPLAAYVHEQGYNAVEFMPILEHPSDESWGYQNTGFFAPTSRYGTADQLRYLIDYLHQHEIAVILDFVPVHFAIDKYALANYDGTALYEYPHSDVGVSEWGSCNFMHSRGEVRSFLQSSANYWLREFHFDGLRMDAISRMIYWQGDPARDVNQNGVGFIRHMNQGLKQLHPTCILIAEDSTNFSRVTAAVSDGGLGFDYKWDMGWMNDTLNYFRTQPDLRPQHYHKLTFSMMYYWDERYLLPLSHDEVVHGKATILQKMYGAYEDKFPQARALYLYMYAHPGKKLNFMGNELGQLREWDEGREQDWSLLSYPLHSGFTRFMSALHALYLSSPALWSSDFSQSGFRWLDCQQEARCLYAFERCASDLDLGSGLGLGTGVGVGFCVGDGSVLDSSLGGGVGGGSYSGPCVGGGSRVVVVLNFSNQLQEGFELSLTDTEVVSLLLDTDVVEFGGSGVSSFEFSAEVGVLACSLAPYSGLLFSVR